MLIYSESVACLSCLYFNTFLRSIFKEIFHISFFKKPTILKSSSKKLTGTLHKMATKSKQPPAL